MLFTFTACDKYNEVNLAENDKIMYNGNTYYENNTLQLYIQYDKLKLVSWDWFIPILGKNEYYADDVEKPLFIYCPRGHFLYTLNNWDFFNDYYTIENSDNDFQINELIIMDEFINNDANDYTETSYIKLINKEHPELCIQLKIYFAENQYFAQYNLRSPLYKAKNTLLDFLENTGDGSMS